MGLSVRKAKTLTDYFLVPASIRKYLVYGDHFQGDDSPPRRLHLFSQGAKQDLVLYHYIMGGWRKGILPFREVLSPEGDMPVVVGSSLTGPCVSCRELSGPFSTLLSVATLQARNCILSPLFPASATRVKAVRAKELFEPSILYPLLEYLHSI